MEKINKNKNRIVITEYHVRILDDTGDATNILIFQIRKSAINCAQSLVSKHMMVEIEKVTSRYPAHHYEEPITCKIINFNHLTTKTEES